MDLERAALKALFYDFPIESMTKMLLRNEYKHFWSIFVGLVKWREQKFSKTESYVLKKIIENKSTDSSSLNNGNNGFLNGILGLLYDFANNVLNYENNEPVVKFEHLLRWHEISVYLGEDTFIIPFIARKDFYEDYNRKWFLWPDILTHNNERMNMLLNEGLSDVHAHLYASCDVFGLNWISLMNCPDSDNIKKLTDMLSMGDQETMEMPILLHPEDEPILMSKLVVLAAAIRVCLFQILYEKEDKSMNRMSEYVLSIIKADYLLPQIRSSIITEINCEKHNALKTIYKSTFDYAITGVSLDCKGTNISSVYMALYGERKLMYKFFCLYFNNKDKCNKIVPYFYLYLLIKIRFRRELVQTNNLIGFENFSEYQKRKCNFFKRESPVFQILPLYAIQSCMRPGSNDSLEARISPGSLDINQLRNTNFKHALFSKKFTPWDGKSVEIVVHFLKDKSNLRKYKLEMLNVLKSKDILKNSTFNIVGIDAAGSEFKARPELFGHIFRYAKIKGITHVTFHAGEDFYDLIDGLRAIDETIMFLEMERGDRIGHALALGTNVDDYYMSRHFNVVLPKIVLLDNLVWLYYKIKEYSLILLGSLEIFIENKCFDLYNDLYTSENNSIIINDFDFFHYRNSMLLRSNGLKDNKFYTYWNETSFCHSEKCELALKDKIALRMFEKYKALDDSKCCMCILPKEICEVLNKIQECMMNDIENRGIAIECNPSSNLKIGRFERYDQHPIFRFFQPYNNEKRAHRINVSINTDDRGVFGTSLYNEYSMIALSMYKQTNNDGSRRWNDDEIENFIKTIIQNSDKQRFVNY